MAHLPPDDTVPLNPHPNRAERSNPDPALTSPPPPDCVTVRTWTAVLLIALVLYAATSQRGVGWQDSGGHVLRAMDGQLRNELGLALSHPLHHWLARGAIALGFAEPAWSVTLVSALFGAVTVANVYAAVVVATRRRSAGLYAAASLAVAHTFWQLSTRAETYTVTSALLSAECWCLLLYLRDRRPAALSAAFVCSGLGLANHLLALLTLPVLGVVLVAGVLRKRLAWIALPLAAVLWTCAALPYTSLIASEWLNTHDASHVARSALFGNSWSGNVLNTQWSLRTLAVAVAFPLLCFPSLLIPTAFLGILRRTSDGPSPAMRAALVAGLLIHTAFVVRYNVADQHMFFLPAYTLLAILGGCGAAGVAAWPDPARRRWMTVPGLGLLVLTPVLHAAAVPLARRLHVLGTAEHHKPYRDDYVYLLNPWSIADDSAERIGREAVSLAAPNGLILVEDAGAAYAVRYTAHRTPHTQLMVQLAGRSINAEHHPLVAALAEQVATAGKVVVLVPFDVLAPEMPAPLGQWTRMGDLYVLDVAPPLPAP